jgi:hypothetical protein
MENSWIIWLTKEGGEAFLGLAPSRGNHRFCVLGKFESDGPNGVGVWVDVDFVQKIAIPSNVVIKTWEVNVRSCLILWRDIAYIQRGEKSDGIGFVLRKSK